MLTSVLIADDVPLNRSLLAHFLKDFMASCEHANDGYEAIAVWEKTQPKLIFMDIEMPNCDGIEASIKIIQSAKEKGLALPKIVAVTGHSQKEQQMKIMEAGFSAMLLKPYNHLEVQAILKKLGL